jgi:hypothetical protein
MSCSTLLSLGSELDDADTPADLSEQASAVSTPGLATDTASFADPTTMEAHTSGEFFAAIFFFFLVTQYSTQVGAFPWLHPTTLPPSVCLHSSPHYQIRMSTPTWCFWKAPRNSC